MTKWTFASLASKVASGIGSTSRKRSRGFLVQCDRFFHSTSPHSGNSAKPLAREDVVDSSGLLQFKTLHELTSFAPIAFKDSPFIGTYVSREQTDDGSGSQQQVNGKFEWMSYGEFGEIVGRCRTVLKDVGVCPYSKVGILSNNRWEWAAVASAAYSLNAVVVPMYETQLPADCVHVINDSECSVLFCGSETLYATLVKEVFPNTPSIKSVLCFDAPSSEQYSFSSALERAKGKFTEEVAPTPEDLSDLIYTSGTTDQPKGVELLHFNIASNVLAARDSTVIPGDIILPSDRSLSILPWAHCFGQNAELWGVTASGGSLAMCRGINHILEDFDLVKPTMLFAPPKIFTKVYNKTQELIESSSFVKRKLIQAALDIGKKHHEMGGKLGLLDGARHKVLDSLVTSKIRSAFGGNMRQMVHGGAACPIEVLEFMDSIGISTYEGYGVTETSPLITVNTPCKGGRRLGSVGRPIPGVDLVIVNTETQLEAKTGEEGEICCYGHNVMKGYHGNPQATAEAISLAPDGKSRMYHTGDLGVLDEDGFLTITGRLKESYKLDNGKFVMPTKIEDAISLSRFIDQVVVCGANRPHNVALIAPDWQAINTELNIPPGSFGKSLEDDTDVVALIDEEIKTRTTELRKYEIPRKWTFVEHFTVENGLLTQKMSIRRMAVIRQYDHIISELYCYEHVGPDLREKHAA